jgi:signal recognition particle subunit SEC65
LRTGLGVRLLLIEVTNAREVVRQRMGKLGGRLIGRVVDAEAQVEKVLIQELENAFREFGIEARIFSVGGPQMIGRSHLEIPLQVREERRVRLNVGESG